MVADRLLQRWGVVDDATKWLVAVTASSSAVAGWALWTKPGLEALWAILASVAAVLSVTHAALSIPQRLKHWEGTKKSFVGLRLQLFALREDMSIDSEFDVATFHKRYVTLRDSYRELMSNLGPETMRTKRLERSVQETLNQTIDDQLRGT